MWPRFESALSREDRGTRRKTRASKKIAPTRPHPDTPANPTVQKTAGVGAAIIDRVRDTPGGRDPDNPPDPNPLIPRGGADWVGAGPRAIREPACGRILFVSERLLALHQAWRIACCARLRWWISGSAGSR